MTYRLQITKPFRLLGVWLVCFTMVPSLHAEQVPHIILPAPAPINFSDEDTRKAFEKHEIAVEAKLQRFRASVKAMDVAHYSSSRPEPKSAGWQKYMQQMHDLFMSKLELNDEIQKEFELLVKSRSIDQYKIDDKIVGLQRELYSSDFIICNLISNSNNPTLLKTQR